MNIGCPRGILYCDPSCPRFFNTEGCENATFAGTDLSIDHDDGLCKMPEE